MAKFTVGELVVMMGLQTDASSFNKGLAVITEVASKIKQVATAAADFAIDAIEHAAETGTKITKLSEQMGLSKAQIQDWGFIAKQSGSSLQSLGTGVRMFERNMWSITHGSNNKQFKAAIAEMGLTSQDVASALKSPDGLNNALFKLADRFKEMGDTPERAALATKLFGARASEMVADLAKGSSALRAMMQDYRDLGAELSDTQVIDLKRLDNNFNRLDAAWQGLKNTLVADLAPALNKIIEAATEWWKVNRKEVVQDLEDGFSYIADLFRQVWDVIVPVAKGIRDAFNSMFSKETQKRFLKDIAAAIVAAIVGTAIAITLLITLLSAAVVSVMEFGRGVVALLGEIWEAIKAIGGFIESVGDGILDAFSAIGDAASAVGASFHAAFDWVVAKLEAIGRGAEWVATKMAELAGGDGGAFSAAINTVKHVSPMISSTALATAAPAATAGGGDLAIDARAVYKITVGTAKEAVEAHDKLTTEHLDSVHRHAAGAYGNRRPR